jgi:hypothetical protein
MNAHQRQRLVNAGFSRKGLADTQFILDRLPTAKHDGFIASITTPRKSTVRRLTDDEVVQRRSLPFSDAELRATVAQGIKEVVTSEINRITGKVQ